MEDESRLHVVLIPWLAMGHLIPFLELAKLLARKGIQISFLSTPKNIKRLPEIPSDISSLIYLVEISLPQVEGLPEDAESTIDLPINKVTYLKKAFDGLKVPLTSFLESSVPNWIIYDFAVHWLPPIAKRLGVPCAFFSLVNAAATVWTGPPSVLLGLEEDPRKSLEALLSVPKWVPFPSKVVFRLHEALRLVKSSIENVADVSESYRFGASIQGCDVVFIRSCIEFEPDWIRLLEEDIFKKTVIPVGLLPPQVKGRSDEKWGEISEWLDKQKQDSVVYVAIGTEAAMCQDEVTELALGLELSELSFFWVIRNLPGLSGEESLTLPDGFEDRVRGRGFVSRGWAPQVSILAHSSVGGFLTHCGWNSIIESLGFGRVLILLPFVAEQGLNARTLEEKMIGLEIPRNEHDGSFTREGVAGSLRKVMVDEEGEIFRTNAREMRGIFGNNHLQSRYIDNFVKYLRDYMHREQ
ncbi:hypothetical protein ACHQM5_016062 [Ranunculus cassubicifolius]